MATTRSTKTGGDKPAGEPKSQPTAEVQPASDEAQERGLWGVETDPTPNEHYTVAGVLAGRPTPETDAEAAKAARRAATGQ